LFSRKTIMIALTVVVVIMISLTIASNSFAVLPTVLAQNQEDRVVGGVSQQDCAKVIDEVKGLDKEDILELADNGGLQDLRISLLECRATTTTANLDTPLQADILEELDPAVVGALGPDIIINLIR
jgi:hypothetical protein